MDFSVDLVPESFWVRARPRAAQFLSFIFLAMLEEVVLTVTGIVNLLQLVIIFHQYHLCKELSERYDAPTQEA